MRFSRSTDRNTPSSDYQALAGSMLSAINSRSGSNDWFAIPYNAPLGTTGDMDLAEFGASTYALREFHNTSIHELAKSISDQIIEVVVKQHLEDKPGQFKKSLTAPNDTDILNADLYAALTLSTGVLFGSRQNLSDIIDKTVEHLIDRFGGHVPNRWVYSENTHDRSVLLGYSTSYQATIIGWGWLLATSLSGTSKQRWIDTLLNGYLAVREDVRVGPQKATEATAWALDWRNVWEIRLALCAEGCLDSSESGLGRVGGVELVSAANLEVAFKVRMESVPGRRPKSSELRKIANFSAIVCALDVIRSEPTRFSI